MIAHFINFWQKAIYVYVNKVHSSFFKDIPVITVHIFSQNYCSHETEVRVSDFYYEFHALAMDSDLYPQKI